MDGTMFMLGGLGDFCRYPPDFRHTVVKFLLLHITIAKRQSDPLV